MSAETLATSTVSEGSSDVSVDAAKSTESVHTDNDTRNQRESVIDDDSSAASQHQPQTAMACEKKHGGTAASAQAKGPEVKKEGGQVASQSSKQLAGSNKLEDQINLQHLVELMKIFYVSSSE